MRSEWRTSSTVGSGGRVEVVIPELRAGDVVDVSVRRRDDGVESPERKLGLLRGKVHVLPGFDDPLPEFEDD